MDLQTQLQAAITDEVLRQAEISEGRLQARPQDNGALEIHGAVDTAALAMVVARWRAAHERVGRGRAQLRGR